MFDTNQNPRLDFDNQFIEDVFDNLPLTSHIPEYVFISGLRSIFNFIQSERGIGNRYPFGLEFVDSETVESYLDILSYTADLISTGQYNLMHTNGGYVYLNETHHPLTLEQDFDWECPNYSLSLVSEFGTFTCTYTGKRFELYYRFDDLYHNVVVQLEPNKNVLFKSRTSSDYTE